MGARLVGTDVFLVEQLTQDWHQILHQYNGLASKNALSIVLGFSHA